MVEELALLANVQACRLSSPETPNPSIEGTHKRLRLLRSPHVKR